MRRGEEIRPILPGTLKTVEEEVQTLKRKSRDDFDLVLEEFPRTGLAGEGVVCVWESEGPTEVGRGSCRHSVARP